MAEACHPLLFLRSVRKFLKRRKLTGKQEAAVCEQCAQLFARKGDELPQCAKQRKLCATRGLAAQGRTPPPGVLYEYQKKGLVGGGFWMNMKTKRLADTAELVCCAEAGLYAVDDGQLNWPEAESAQISCPTLGRLMIRNN